MSETVSYKLKDLKEQARTLGLKGWSTYNKPQLIELLDAHLKPAEPEPVAETKPKRGKTHQSVVAENTAFETPAPVAEPVPVNQRKKKDVSASPWHQFLTAYCAEHGCTRKSAMEKKDEYAKFKEGLVKA